MMASCVSNKMSQRILFTCYWLLAVGRGSGLSGLTSKDRDTSTIMPHPARTPPHSTTPSLIVEPAGAQVHPLVNISLSLHTAQRNISRLQSGGVHLREVLSTPRSITTTAYSTSSPSTSTTPVTPMTSTLPLRSTAQVEVTPKDKPSTEKLPNSTVQPEGPTRPTKIARLLTKEQFHSVPSTSQREWFIRRKHKGPYYANRVKKLSVALRSTDPPEVEDHLVENRSGLNSSEVVTPRKNLTKLHGTTKATKSTNNRLNKSTRKPLPTHYTLSADKQNVTKKYKSVERPRKRPINMGIPASSTVLQVHRATTTPQPIVETYNPPDSDEYYSSYGEYPDLPVLGYNASGYMEAAVLPDPDNSPVDEVAEAEVVLPDDSLADTDLHDHDLIDSVMYIYFGSSERDERGAGKQVLIVGAVISLVAQFLTLVSVLRRLRTRPDESASLILLNAELALTAGNLVFMLGVQATSSQRRCELVAVSLHYLHLVTCCWFLVNSMFSYSGLQQTETRRRLRPWWLSAWCGPAAVVLACVVFNRRGYETRAFCWMSVARGMLYSFMVPVAVLILLNTCLAVLGMRQLSLSPKTEDSDRKSMRVSATLLPVFAVVWFLGVVALENSASLVFPLLFVASSGFLNWFVLACWLPADMSLWRETDDDFDDDDEDLYEEVLKTQVQDSQPLLEDPPIYVCGRRDMCELQMDPICTISS